MEEGKQLVNENVTNSYDTSERLFDFLLEQGETALVCENDSASREKMNKGLKLLGYAVNEAESAKDALEKMRFHIFDVLLIHDDFEGGKGAQELLKALELLDMSFRRKMFVALVGDSFRTMDNMAAFHRSVNLVIHSGDLNELGAIIKHGVQENKVFYHTYAEALRNMGRI